MAIISLQNVSKDHRRMWGLKRLPGIRNVGFQIEAGKFYHFVGHLGAGKTTLARILVGLSRPTSGDILREPTISGPITTGYMSEEIDLPQRMGIGEALSYFVGLRGLSKSRSLAKGLDPQNLMQRLQLERFANVHIDASPVGVRRRLQFAIAVANAPDLVVLDEPLYAFDVAANKEAVAILRELKIAGSAVIALSGELTEFQELTDIRVVLRNHTIAYRSDSVDSGHKNSGSLHEVEFTGTSFENVQRLQQLKSLPEPSMIQQIGFQQRLRFGDYEQALVWLNAAVTNGVVVTRFEEILSDSPRQLEGLLLPEEK